jgi:hypothetical protein
MSASKTATERDFQEHDSEMAISRVQQQNVATVSSLKMTQAKLNKKKHGVRQVKSKSTHSGFWRRKGAACLSLVSVKEIKVQGGEVKTSNARKTS